MSPRPLPHGPGRWRAAADHLARRVSRRARLEAALRPLSRALLLGAGGGLLARALGWLPGGALVALLLPAAFVLLALPLAWRAGRRVAPVEAGWAAWALDRLAGARERGLTAAVAPEPVAAEAALAAPALPDPPDVRLEPPRALAWTGAGLLLALAGVLLAGAPGESGGAAGAGSLEARADRPAGAGDLEQARAEEARAQALAAAAERARDIAAALGLDEREAGPAEVAERLSDPDRPGGAHALDPAAAEALGLSGPPTEADAGRLAEAIAQGARAAREAAEARRRAVGLRARAPADPLPAGRRALVARYLGALARADGDGR